MTTIEETIKHFESLQKRYIKTHNGKMCEKVHIALSALKENAELKARLEKAIELPCKVGDTVYIISKCENVAMYYDNDYYTGTGAVECPFENVCDCEECDDNNEKIFEAVVSGVFYGTDNDYIAEMSVAHLKMTFTKYDINKTVFLSADEAEVAKERIENE